MTHSLSLWIGLTLLAAGPAAAHAQADREPGEELTVFLATMGQGDQVWELFGHNGIWIHDAATGSTIAYGYGAFAFDQPGFVRRLMRGSMLYSMSVHDAQAELAHYAQSNRTVWLQRLNLTAWQRHELREFLEWNWQPANRDYLYDYYRDNCSTRVRDALDRALVGALRASLEARSTGTTYRSESLRLVAARPEVYAGLALGLGRPVDRPLDAWEESFVPMRLMTHIRTVQVPGPDGAPVPLVAEEHVLNEAERPAEATSPPNFTVWFLGIGVLLGGVLALLGRQARRVPAARRARRPAVVGLAAALAVWGAVAGFFGLILALLWTATDHQASHVNLNLLQVNPIGLLFGLAAPLAVLGRTGRLARLAWPAAVALVALAVAGLIVKLTIGLQANGPIIALVLPVHVGAAYALYQAGGPEPTSREDVSARQTAAAAA